MKRGRQESNLRRPAFQAGALPAELRPHAGDPKHPLLTVSWRVAERPYASGTVLGHTARSQEGGQRREAGGPAAAGQGSVSRRGWDRTSDLLFVRQALVPTELLAHEWTGRESNPRTTALLPQLPLRRGCFAELSATRPTNPGQGIEPRPPGSGPGVLPVRRSRNIAGGHSGAEAPAG